MFKETPFVPYAGRYITMEDFMLERNMIWVQGKITGDIIDSLLVQLALIEERFLKDIKNYENNIITVCINSGGGSLWQALNFAEALIASPFQVRTVITGYAYSAAALIALAGDEDKRLMFPHSQIMLHEPFYTRNNISDESVEGVEQISQTLQKNKQLSIDFIASRTKLTKAAINKLITNRRAFIDAQTAIEKGFVATTTNRFFLKEHSDEYEF